VSVVVLLQSVPWSVRRWKAAAPVPSIDTLDTFTV
jgi:hypothetical protein